MEPERAREIRMEGKGGREEAREEREVKTEADWEREANETDRTRERDEDIM